MQADELDQYLEDPSLWVLTKFLPRLSPHLSPMANLGRPHDVFNYSAGLQEFAYSVYKNPGIIDAFERLRDAGEVVARYKEHLQRFKTYAAANLGLPGLLGYFCYAPFDNFSNDLRGYLGSTTDLYRQPEKLKSVLERLTPWAITRCIKGAVRSGNPIVTIYIMKGADAFMSQEQFEEFYWPSLKTLIAALIEQGLLVYVFTQGCNDERLKYFTQFPSGHIVVHLEAGTDIFNAKTLAGGKFCLDGNVPNSILANGTGQEVEDYCRKLIDICGKDGGFIMDFSAFLDDCSVSNMHRLVKVTREHGRYQG